MQKSEGVVILMNRSDIRYLVGSELMEVKPLPVYSEIVCDFLDDLSKELRSDSEAKKFADIQTFSFWCRKGNIARLKEAYYTRYRRVGRGLVFSIAPSNVPINFAFSLVFGMISGNANVVRVSEKEFPQTEIVCRNLRKLLKKPHYDILKNQIQVVSYGHDREINDFYSTRCDIRVIWGGDEAIAQLRQSPIKPRCTEITFADRYSFALFDEKAVLELSDKDLAALAEKFYNDTYLFDQNACSSPHLILWKASQNSEGGRKRFWEVLYKAAEKYDLQEKKVLDKYTILCENAAVIEQIDKVERYGNLLYVAKCSGIPNDIDTLRGKFGLFYETEFTDIQETCKRLSSKVQTCVTFGIDNKELLDAIIDNHAGGIDRIVSVGDAMNIGVYWDGYDVVGSMSRGVILD